MLKSMTTGNQIQLKSKQTQKYKPWENDTRENLNSFWTVSQRQEVSLQYLIFGLLSDSYISLVLRANQRKNIKAHKTKLFLKFSALKAFTILF
ncbi:hypothetical protein FGO68_gene9166 [Halteria grandinella]|uniref:Uncharacterized protein n=1 Tax=Halteria grandinella TaxID=5974 RepID=A0A8J8NNN6_HALGN|nr:hypothetical protein FGO68_gene9166 [Halteria grandinella]